MSTCSFKVSLRVRKSWGHVSTHSLRLFTKLSFSVVHVGTSGQQRADSGIEREDTPKGGNSNSSKVGGVRPFSGHLGSSFLGTDHPFPGALMEALEDRVET